jgi:hypothetical protein
MGSSFNARSFLESHGLDYDQYVDAILSHKSETIPQVGKLIKDAVLKDSSRIQTYEGCINLLTGHTTNQMANGLMSQLVWQSMPESKRHPLHVSPGFDAGRILFFYPQTKQAYLFSIYAIGWDRSQESLAKDSVKGHSGEIAPFKVKRECVDLCDADTKNPFGIFNFDTCNARNTKTECYVDPVDALEKFYDLTHGLSLCGEKAEIHMLERNDNRYGSIFSSPSLRDNLHILAFAFKQREHLKGYPYLLGAENESKVLSREVRRLTPPQWDEEKRTIVYA